MSELRKTMNKMPNKRGDVHESLTKVMKFSFMVLDNKYLEIIKTSLEKGVFCEEWGISLIVPSTTKSDESRPMHELSFNEN